MRKTIIENIYEYEITKNEGKGIKGYGWHLDIYKNGIKVLSDGAYGAESMAHVSARDFFLLEEFGIDRPDDREGLVQNNMKKRALANMPNLDYKVLNKTIEG